MKKSILKNLIALFSLNVLLSSPIFLSSKCFTKTIKDKYHENLFIELFDKNKKYNSFQLNNLVLNKDYFIIDNNINKKPILVNKIILSKDFNNKISLNFEILINQQSFIKTLDLTNNFSVESSDFTINNQILKFFPNNLIDQNTTNKEILQWKLKDFLVKNTQKIFDVKLAPSSSWKIKEFNNSKFLTINYYLIYKPTQQFSEIFSYEIKLYDSKHETYFPFEYSQTLEANKATTVSLKHVNDGDTFTDTQGRKFRFAGIDTPEKWIPKLNQPTEGLQYEYALRASEFTSKILNNVDNQIIVVPQETKGGSSDITDHYGRYVAFIFYKDKNGNLHNLCNEIISGGYAKIRFISKDPSNKYYNKNTWYVDLLFSSQRKARDQKLGIWGVANIQDIYPK